ncbi:hypothetical protein [Pyrococcus yayanosii]|uniref:Transcription regulator TrmB C-terminal domain-containing protein n=1 Tax=Pyrococcus yayanosii (strain CH1 / JCM 16557) TaxID=529709 RepID=F8AGF6_PYRYC|nr:hypothetical protein [Pyrococcus yayanosii]AEH25152.1 hypothetical protein PYCH_14840 [Pyrococcus yayanosii CH1]
MNIRRFIPLILTVALLGVLLNSLAVHYRGGEIYEAANEAMNLLVKGFNVTIEFTTPDERILRGELFAVRGSTIVVIINGTDYTLGGPEATKEDFRAKEIRVIARGKVYVYEVPPTEGEAEEAFSRYLTEAYSERFSGLIYIEGNVTSIELGRLKYMADYKSYGSLTILQLGEGGAVISTNMVPIRFLMKGLAGHRVYFYGILYVNSEERTLPLKLIEVRTR